MANEKRKRALVLSGGNAFGAFQVGALKYLLDQNPSVSWDVIAGVSVGALNGTMMALDRFEELERIWLEISNDKVYKGEADIEGFRGKCRVMWRELTKESLLDNSPLEQTLTKIFDTRDIINHLSEKDRKLFIGVVSLVDGKYYAVQPGQFTKRPEDFRAAVLASTAIPMYWPPVDLISLDDGTIIKQAVDGGVRNKSPLGDVMTESPEEVVVINCDSYNVPVRDVDYGGIFRIALRATMEIQHNETFRMDLKEFIRLNEIAKSNKVEIPIRGEKKLLKPVSITLIQPYVADVEKMGDPFSFSQQDVRNRMEVGRLRAEEFLNNPDEIIQRFLNDNRTRG